MACTVVPEIVTAQVTTMFVVPGLDLALEVAWPPGNGDLPYVAMSACAFRSYLFRLNSQDLTDSARPIKSEGEGEAECCPVKAQVFHKVTGVA